ncbi:MAG: presenilin family intramembrane aspartyl protease [Nanoarchaeota archaeon]
MKHNYKITAIILGMFFIAQFIGLFVINHYSTSELPYGMQNPDIQDNSQYVSSILPSIVFAFALAIVLVFLLTRYNIAFVMKLWFFIVVTLAIGIFINIFIPNFNLGFISSSTLALVFALPFALEKVVKRNLIVHNLTELVIYPSIASVFVPLLNLWSMIILLIIISIYDMWAVWHSGIMQKMAKYQVNTIGIMAGFFIPYVSAKVHAQIKKLSPEQLKKKKIKAQVAILGGGDVVFPIITAGVLLRAFGILPALFVIVGAAIGLSYLLFFAEKKKFYPAMPFITAGMFAGMLISWLMGLLV